MRKPEKEKVNRTSEKEKKRKHAAPFLDTRKKPKPSGKGEQKLAANISRDDDESDPSHRGRKQEHDIRLKKRNRKSLRESSMSSIARGSSSSQERNKKH